MKEEVATKEEQRLLELYDKVFNIGQAVFEVGIDAKQARAKGNAISKLKKFSTSVRENRAKREKLLHKASFVQRESMKKLQGLEDELLLRLKEMFNENKEAEKRLRKK